MTPEEIRDHNWSIEGILVELTAQVADLGETLCGLNERLYDYFATLEPEPENREK